MSKWHRQRDALSSREMPLDEIAQVVVHLFLGIEKELPFGFEIAELERQMHRRRDCSNGLDRLPFGRAEVEIEIAFLLGKTWQSIQFVNFLVR